VEHHFEVFADGYYFYIQDAGTKTPHIKHAVALWETFYDQDHLAYHRDGVLLVGTERDKTVPVTIATLDSRPSDDVLQSLLDQASHTVETHFMAYTGDLMLHGPLDDEASEHPFQIPAGSYRVLIYYNHLDKAFKNNLEGKYEDDETYHLIFYPGDMTELKVLKRFLWTDVDH
jgi:hypothetical protein